ncbi:MAG: PIN domain-containing protein [Acidimicrobiales bacterium]
MDAGSVCSSFSRGARGSILSRLLFDTTFLIDAERSGEALDDAVGDDDDGAIAAITVAELRVGVLLATGRNRAARLAFLEDVLQVIPILDYDREVAEAHAELLGHVRRQGRPRGAHDLLIAATAKAAGRTVVSADDTAFAGMPGVQARTHR